VVVRKIVLVIHTFDPTKVQMFDSVIGTNLKIDKKKAKRLGVNLE
jgi:hypothetical protein